MSAMWVALMGQLMGYHAAFKSVGGSGLGDRVLLQGAVTHCELQRLIHALSLTFEALSALLWRLSHVFL